MNNMPRKLINNYTFYKIVCLDNAVDLRYVGSTADFNKRKSSHKSECYNEKRPAYNYKVYKTIRDNGGWSNFKMIEIAKQDQLTLRQAEFIEEQYRKELNADMNGRSCFRTEEERKEQCKEWRENNPDYDKNWRKNNKEHIQEQKKEWYKNNKEHIKKYNQTESRKASQKKYRDKKKLEKQQKDITITNS